MENHLDDIKIQTWSSLKTDLIWVYDGPPHSRAKVSGRPLSSFSVWLIKAGQLKLTTNQGDQHFSSDQWVVLPRSTRRHEFSEDARILSINFKAHWPNGSPLFCEDKLIHFPAASFPRLRSTAQPLVKAVTQRYPNVTTKLLDQRSGPEAYLRLKMLFMPWLLSFVQALRRLGVAPSSIGQEDPRIAEALGLMEDQPFGQTFDERRMAAMVGLSRAQFARLFVRHTGMTAKVFYDTRRLQRARENLASTEAPIKQIAYQLGFKDQAHFTNWFRQRVGVTPSTFRAGRLPSWKKL